ncbi:MAG: hypothetical protein GEU78_09550 [Actinobacteria bacterium]|nr:hypothetical protein [Actinomycetota bacterium]
MSDTTAAPVPALAAALAKVQAELPELERDRTVEVQQKSGGTYSYSYVTLANLTKAIMPLLAKHGLAFAAMPGAGTDGKMCLRYHLLHESGERLTGEFPISGEGGIQMIGGRITYSRRYCLAALVGIAADEDDESRLDDSGRGTAQRANAGQAAKPAAKKTAQRTQRSPSAPPPLPTEPEVEPIRPAQLSKLQINLKEYGITDRDAGLAYYEDVIGREVASSKELTKDEASRVIDQLEREIAATKPADEYDPTTEEGWNTDG